MFNDGNAAPIFKDLILQIPTANDIVTSWGSNEVWLNCVFISVPGAAARIIRHGNGNTRTYKNCTFVTPSDNTANTAMILQSVSGIVNFINCAFFGHTALTSGTGTFNYTTCISEVGSPPSGVTTSTYANALFESSLEASMDFRHQESSTLTDAGTDDADTATDIFGNTRTSDAYDVGAFEYIFNGGVAAGRLFFGVGV